VEVEMNRLHCEVENTRKRCSMEQKPTGNGKGEKGRQTLAPSENGFPIEIPMKSEKSPEFSRDNI
jgi:hypothetical protein